VRVSIDSIRLASCAVDEADEQEFRALLGKYPDNDKLRQLQGSSLAQLRAEWTPRQKSEIARELSNLKDQSALHRLLQEPPAWLAGIDRGARDVYYSMWLAQLFEAIHRLMLKRLAERAESEEDHGGDENQPPSSNCKRLKPSSR